jgi:hypothetical protein
MLAIALGRCCGPVRVGILGSRFVLDAALCLAFFALAAIAGGLLSAFLFAVFGGPVVQVGLGDSPSPSGFLTVAAAVPIEGMIGREVAIAPLE